MYVCTIFIIQNCNFFDFREEEGREELIRRSLFLPISNKSWECGPAGPGRYKVHYNYIVRVYSPNDALVSSWSTQLKPVSNPNSAEARRRNHFNYLGHNHVQLGQVNGYAKFGQATEGTRENESYRKIIEIINKLK